LTEARSSATAALRTERERCTALESELSARSDAVAEAQVTCHAAQAEADKAAYQLAEAQLSLESLTVSILLHTYFLTVSAAVCHSTTMCFGCCCDSGTAAVCRHAGLPKACAGSCIVSIVLTQI
jgi:hypothetical protein